MIITIKKSHIRVTIALGLFFLILLVAFFTNPNLTGNVISDSTENSGYDSVEVGKVGILYIEGLTEVILAATLEDLKGLIVALKEGNQASLEKMIEDEKIFWVPGGTKAGVLVIDSGIIKVEILERNLTETTGWIISEWIVNP